MYKLSIITVVFNNISFIEQTITNVLKLIGQRNDIEYIVIDGNSDDGTVNVIKRYQDKITLWISEPDEGIYDAMNKGVKKASGDWLIFMNSGDMFHDDFIINWPNFFSNGQEMEGYDILYGDVVTKNEQKLITINQNNITPNFFFSDTICHQCVLFKRTTFSNFGYYNLDYRIIADRDLLFRIAKANRKFFHLNMIVCIWDEEGFSKENISLFNLEEKNFIFKNWSFIKRIFLTLRGRIVNLVKRRV